MGIKDNEIMAIKGILFYWPLISIVRASGSLDPLLLSYDLQ